MAKIEYHKLNSRTRRVVHRQESNPSKISCERNSDHTTASNQYQRVEFSVDGLPYHFKIWNTNSMPMCVVITENSNILARLKVGDKLKMKYYSANSIHPISLKETAIRKITKDEQGRFKRSYLVDLEILESQV